MSVVRGTLLSVICYALQRQRERERDGQRGILVIMCLYDGSVCVCVCVCEAAVSSHTHTHARGGPQGYTHTPVCERLTCSPEHRETQRQRQLFKALCDVCSYKHLWVTEQTPDRQTTDQFTHTRTHTHTHTCTHTYFYLSYLFLQINYSFIKLIKQLLNCSL